MKPTRREVLTTLLGAPALLAASCSRGTERVPEGEIVGASDGIGHRLRDGVRITPPSDRWERAGVVIVGAGVAGLSAAWRLLRAGFDDFVLLELEPVAGGTSRSGRSPVVAYPWGAHYIPAPTRENAALVMLLDEMGVLEGRDDAGEPVVAEQFLCREPQERVFYKGHWYEGLYLQAGASADDAAQFEAFRAEIDRWVAWRDGRGRRAFAIPMATGSDDPEVTSLDRLTMAEWLDARGFTSPRLRWLVDYGCRDDYGLRAADASAWAGLFYFASRVREPGAEPQPLVTWPEGNGRLVSHLAVQVKSKIRLGWAVAEIISPARNNFEADDANSADAAVAVVAVDHSGEQAIGIRADRVIFAAPQFVAPYLVRGLRDERGSTAAEFEYGAWMVANLHLSRRPAGRGFPLAWDNVIYESASLGYVVATHQRGLDHGPTVFTYYYPLCDSDARAARSKLLDADWRDWVEVVLADLARAHPGIRSLAERIDVCRWGHAMIRPRPGFVWGGGRAAAVWPFRGVHFAHSDLSGVALFEEAFYHGVRAAEEVLAARGVESRSMLKPS